MWTYDELDITIYIIHHGFSDYHMILITLITQRFRWVSWSFKLFDLGYIICILLLTLRKMNIDPENHHELIFQPLFGRVYVSLLECNRSNGHGQQYRCMNGSSGISDAIVDVISMNPF